MKEGIHPKYGPAVITCACGNRIELGSTKSAMRTEVCSSCHPFYTGITLAAGGKGRPGGAVPSEIRALVRAGARLALFSRPSRG